MTVSMSVLANDSACSFILTPACSRTKMNIVLTYTVDDDADPHLLSNMFGYFMGMEHNQLSLRAYNNKIHL